MINQVSLQESFSYDSSESSDKEPETEVVKLNPLNPLLPPGYKIPFFHNGIPISSIVPPTLVVQKSNTNFKSIDTVRSDKKTDNKPDNYEPNVNLNDINIGLINDREENKIPSDNVTRKTIDTKLKINYMEQFFKEFQDFNIRLVTSEKLCCSKPSNKARLIKLKHNEIGNEDYKSKLITYVEKKFKVNDNNRLQNLSIVDLYMICSILEDVTEIKNSDRFVDYVENSTSHSITLIQNMKLNDQTVLEFFFKGTREFLIGELKMSETNNSYKLSLNRLNSLLNQPKS